MNSKKPLQKSVTQFGNTCNDSPCCMNQSAHDANAPRDRQSVDLPRTNTRLADGQPKKVHASNGQASNGQASNGQVHAAEGQQPSARPKEHAVSENAVSEHAVSEFAASKDGSPTMFQSIVADAEEGVLLLGSDGLVNYANAAAEFLLGQGRADLSGEMFGLPRSATSRPTTVNVISSDGCLRLVELRVEPLPGAPDGSQLLRLKDVTAHHQDIASAREQVRRRDEFLAMLSHEIRNPLAAIRSAASLLSRDECVGDTRRTAGQVFDRQFKHLQRILDDLLDVTRISRGKLQIERSRIDVCQVLRDALEESMPFIEERAQHLQVDLPASNAWVEGDQTRLGQVVVNLVNNASKFTPRSGNIGVAMRVTPESVTIEVCDDGPGVDAELLPKIFEPFVQGAQNTARSNGGLGIGLSLVRNIVHMHHGTVQAERNAQGRGMCFRVQLPACEPGEHDPAAIKGDPQETLRILIVEDSDDARTMLRKILELEGHDIIEAANGRTGLEAVFAHLPDIALIDLGLPEINGYELAERIRSRLQGNRIRLIAVTGYAMPQDLERTREAGFDAHLVKPLRYPEMNRLLREQAAQLENPKS